MKRLVPVRKWFLWKKENWKTYKYPLRKDKWQSSGAILPLPSTKIGRLSPPLLLNSGFLKDLNLFLYKYPLRKDRWQSSGAIHPLPLAKIGGLSSLPPPSLEFRFSKGFEPVSLRYRWVHYYQLSSEIKPLLRSKGGRQKGVTIYSPPPQKKTAGI